ncbi:hypothetical protein ABC766_09200 [Methylobacterium fujisawaense]
MAEEDPAAAGWEYRQPYIHKGGQPQNQSEDRHLDTHRKAILLATPES